MSGAGAELTRLQALLDGMRRRYWLRGLAFAAPLILLLGALLLRWNLWPQPLSLWPWLVFVAVLAVALVWLAHRRYTLHGLLRQLDQRLPQLQDSSALLLQQAPDSPVAVLQQARVREALRGLSLPDLRARWHGLALTLLWSGCAALLLVLHAWPRSAPQLPPSDADRRDDLATGPSHTRLSSVQLQITPPAYTGVPPSTLSELDARVPEGSQLRWQLQFDPAPSSVELKWLDGTSLPLTLSGDGAESRWTAQWTLRQASLYRLALPATAPPLQPDALHTLGVIADAPPVLRVIEPQLSLTRIAPEQSHWNLELEATDDYGLGAAELLLTRTQGTGEQVTVSEQRIALTGRGDARQRRYRHQLDLKAMELAEGDDLIVRFEVLDRRQPQPQRSRTASYILRWPAPPIGEASGVEGLVNTTLPAYFRSQRQIIIDTEALLAESPRRDAEAFGIRSDEIGVDQRLLRLRYGQFLGEEFEPPPAPPGLGTAESKDGEDEHAGHDHGPADGHDHGPETSTAAFGDAGAVQAEYGHIHDIAEAATLLDPATRKLLKAALDEMWQAELYLRSAQPRAALPYERRALELIKQVQQGSRIYLARVGLELPPIDFERRFTGKREGLRPRADPLTRAANLVETDPINAAWLALDDWQMTLPTDTDARAGLLLALQALLQHAAANSDRMDSDQRLALLARIDALQQDPQCAECAQALRTALWPLLRAPPAGLRLRPSPDVGGAAYLEALTAPREAGS